MSRSPNPARRGAADPRSGCHGAVSLSARLEPWQLALCRDPARLDEWIELHGSPLNILDPSPMARNAADLRDAAAGVGLDLKIFFARKANKALALVDEAHRLGLGIDVASERELGQTLDRRVPAEAIVVTAAVKPRGLLELCAARRPTVVLDNEDEVRRLASIADHAQTRLPVALRLAPGLDAARARSRFGTAARELLAIVDRHWTVGASHPLAIAGVHFHLDGYDPGDRATAIEQSLEVVDALRARGHQPEFIDIGGGIPISYLDDAGQWELFWHEHRAAMRGERAHLTYEGHGLGLTSHAGEVAGRPSVYPYFQSPTSGAWLTQMLGTRAARSEGQPTIAAAVRASGLELRCEPGRSLLDGCGMTVARVEFRKQRSDGVWLIGVAMNRTQCRSTSDDFLVDPLLLRPRRGAAVATGRATRPIEGYLVGAYCIERELLTWRRMVFPRGVRVGDILIFPNTGGYLMHILESASHQIPLARNLIVGSAAAAVLDPIDEPEHRPRGAMRENHPAGRPPGAQAAADQPGAAARRAPSRAPAHAGRAPAGRHRTIRSRLVAVAVLSALAAVVALLIATSEQSQTPRLALPAARVVTHARYWTVRPGQTLTTIASREQTRLIDLERLNPHLVARALVPGQRVRLPG